MDPKSVIDLRWSIQGTVAPTEHGYSLYSAISSAVPQLHGATWLGIHPLRGRREIEGQMRLAPRTWLTLRMPAEKIPEALSLAGKTLKLDGHRLVVGVPHVTALTPAATLVSRLVVIRLTSAPKGSAGKIDTESFRTAFEQELRRQLGKLGAGTAEVTVGPKRQISVARQRILGFGVRLGKLSPEASVQVQAVGIGGKRRMGCGVFVPSRAASA